MTDSYINNKVRENNKKKELILKVLKKEMKLIGFNSINLADEISVTKQTISNWLTGKCTPDIIQIKSLKALGFSDTACLEPSKNVEV